MDKTTIANLKRYKNKNSGQSVRNRARNIFLTLTKEDGNSFEFSYMGTQRTPYVIKVYAKGKSIETSCSCPYDYAGICKHKVAAINHIVGLYEKKEAGENVDLFGNIINNEVKREFDTINLKNHLITDELIAKLNKNNFNGGAHFIRFQKFTRNHIITNYVDWPYHQQNLVYDTNSQELTVKCSCEETRNYHCKHILSALMRIKIEYGENFFSPNYLEEHIDEFLQQYGMTSKDDDYKKYFDFDFNEKGLSVKEKVKNIMPSLDVFSEKILPDLDEKGANLLYLPKEFKTNTVPTHGVGFCFILLKRNIFYFLEFAPFTAKYKKNTTEFASTFKIFNDSYDLISKLEDRTEKEKSDVLKVLEIERKNDSFNYNFSLGTLRETNAGLNAFINESSEDYHFFIKKAKGSFIKKNLIEITFSKEVPKVYFTLTKKDVLYKLTPKIKINNRSYQINSTKIIITPFFCVLENVIYPFTSSKEFLYLWQFRNTLEINFLEKDYDKLYETVIVPISKYFDVETTVFKTKKLPAKTTLKKQVFVSDYEGEYIMFKLGVQYDKKLILIESRETLFDEKTQKIIQRDEVFESEFVEEFRELHPDFDTENNGVFFLSPFQLIENEWLLKTSEKLKQKDIELFGAKDLKSFNFNLNKPVVTMGVKSDIDWFDVNIEIKYGNQKASLREIRKAFLKKSKYVQLKDGTLGMLPDEWLTKFSKYFKAGEVKNNSIKISNYQFNIVDELYEDLDKTPKFLLDLQRKKQQLQNLKDIEPVKPPRAVKATLRSYQQEGLNWLVFLYENNLGGCLADDMGLGKTLQTISLLAYLKSKKKLKNPNLIIAPTSLMFNWEKEIEKFCPSLKTLVYIGTKRKQQLENFDKFNIILTTYGSILNDVEELKKKAFDYVILDESQAIKNPNSKRYKAVRLLNANNRLALTGTPIENNTFDLYAQMNFLNPGLLGSMSHFKTEFSDAIDKAKNESASELLHQIIHPFLMRRTKAQVATDLPEKTENILYCEMGTAQRKVYDVFKNKFREYLLNKFDENGAEKSQMYVLEGLTKLRQICNSPQLLNEEEDYGSASVKLDLLIENIKTKTTDNKVLVFSQFTTMLSLIEDRLKNEDILYEYLDGKTRNREERVQNFQESKEIKVFLISLKAGGVGLNLTAAEYVFLVDPWWNPAVENQAIDRCYRIGQTKHVMAYRMICKDTIEEKIIDLQKSKKQVSNSIIQIDKVKKSFDKQQIKELFS